MKERPILFSSPMVRAILEGRKTQTRRVIKPQPKTEGLTGVYADRYNRSTQWAFWLPDNRMTEPRLWSCPYGVLGDRLWVRETLGVVANWGSVQYAADNTYLYEPDMRKVGFPYADECEAMVERWGDDYYTNDLKLIPSIFMPRWASRITLEITDVRVQRLQEISSTDSIFEGIRIPDEKPVGNAVFIPRDAYRELWDSINAKKHPWSSNPWVWVLAFKLLGDVRG